MFSGLIAYRGTVLRTSAHVGGGLRLAVACEGVEQEAPVTKDSIAVNGVCLTAASIVEREVEFDVIPETLARSALGALQPGERVNLEYSLRLGDRLGGHLVYAHVDATGAVLARTAQGQGERVRIELPPSLRRFVVEKGYIAADGVSLTVASAQNGWFELALIPETLQRTTLGQRPVGSRVNLEVDPIARYALAQVQTLGPEIGA
ncbi:MAG: riboflavin synthase [Vulcanimicrobiaceae bacterium]